MAKIHIIIAILDEIQKLNIKNPSVVTSNSRSENPFTVNKLLFNSMTIVASNINTHIISLTGLLPAINPHLKKSS